MLDIPGLAYRCFFFLGTEGVDRQVDEDWEKELSPSQEYASSSRAGL